MSNIDQLMKNLQQFRDERDWRKYHTPKDLAISISLEAAEVLEHFQWKTAEEVEQYVVTHKEKVTEELADVLKYVLHLADVLEIDIVETAIQKLERDSAKYPVEKIKGNYKKYNQIESHSSSL